MCLMMWTSPPTKYAGSLKSLISVDGVWSIKMLSCRCYLFWAPQHSVRGCGSLILHGRVILFLNDVPLGLGTIASDDCRRERSHHCRSCGFSWVRYLRSYPTDEMGFCQLLRRGSLFGTDQGVTYYNLRSEYESDRQKLLRGVDHQT